LTTEPTSMPPFKHFSTTTGKGGEKLLGADGGGCSEDEGLGHQYSENMLRDIFQFIEEKLKNEETS
jgi:hypothetical protein